MPLPQPEALQYLCPNQNPSQESVQLVQPSKEYRNKCDADCINKLAPGAEANSSTSDRFLKTLADKLNLNANIITLSESRKISSKKKKSESRKQVVTSMGGAPTDLCFRY